METELKQRLIGAIVLTLIAAIFVPLFLSDMPVTHIPEEQESDSEIIPQSSLVPVTEINEVIEQPLIETPEPITEVNTIEQPLQEAEIQANDVATQPTKNNTPIETPVVEQIQSVESVSITTSAVNTPDKTEQLMGIGKGWLVQLGSFESEENAIKLNQTLLEKQFKSFIDPIKNPTTNKTAYRVRVGPPQADKAKAEALKKQLNELVKIQGIIIEYP